MTPSGTEHATFQLVAQCLNRPCHRVHYTDGTYSLYGCQEESYTRTTKKGYGYVGARTDKTHQTNICLGIHIQTCVATFNLTGLSRLLASVCLLWVTRTVHDVRV